MPGCERLRWALSLLIPVLCTSATQRAAGDWPTDRGDYHRSGLSSEAIELPIVESWVHRAAHPPQPAWPEMPARLDVYRAVKLGPTVVFDRALHPVVDGDANKSRAVGQTSRCAITPRSPSQPVSPCWSAQPSVFSPISGEHGVGNRLPTTGQKNWQTEAGILDARHRAPGLPSESIAVAYPITTHPPVQPSFRTKPAFSARRMW